MTDLRATNAPLFTEFLDPVDMIGCFKADASLESINTSLDGHGLRFPMVLDPGRSLSEHVAISEYAPASARFGPYVDNVLGMNWELPTGRVVRIGERVVKSTTGYDLQRFLLHGDGRFGRALDFVLRLRPVAGARVAGRFTGSTEQLQAMVHALRRNSWTHWIDCIDLIVTADAEEALQVEVDCRPGEEAVFIAYFEKLANECGASFVQGDVARPTKLPFFSIKCLPSGAVPIARRCVENTGGTARVLVLNGVILLWPDKAPLLDWLLSLNRELESVGGHVAGKLDHQATLSRDETQWLRTLEEGWAGL